jgi:hypothetical protein
VDVSEILSPLKPLSISTLDLKFQSRRIRIFNQIISNDKELKTWIQKHIKWMEEYHDPWFKIHNWKIFEDPKDFHGTKYIIIVHFLTPKGYWLQYDI